MRVAGCCSSTNSVSSRPTEIGSPTGSCGRRPSAADKPDLIAGLEAKAPRDGIDERGIVARGDAEVIADLIGDAGGQGDFDMPGRSFGAPLFCNSRLTSTFIGAAPAAAGGAGAALGATGSTR